MNVDISVRGGIKEIPPLTLKPQHLNFPKSVTYQLSF